MHRFFFFSLQMNSTQSGLVGFVIQTHHFHKSPEQEAFPYSWGSGEVQLVAQRWSKNEIIHICRKGEMGQSSMSAREREIFTLHKPHGNASFKYNT